MKPKDFRQEDLKKILLREGVSRRALLKWGIGGGLAYLAWKNILPTGKPLNRKRLRGRIVIVGGGFAGCSVANFLTRNLTNPDITIIEPDETSVSYQPGQTLVGAGIWQMEEIIEKSAHYFPKQAKWIKEPVVEYEPDQNRVETASNQQVAYDFLIVTPGIQLNYHKIEGMSRDLIGRHGIASIYAREGAAKSWDVLRGAIDRGGRRGVTGVFTHPNTPIKCAGASKKIVFLAADRFEEARIPNRGNLTYFTSSSKMLKIPEFHKVLEAKFEEKALGYRYRHNLVAIDPHRREATFHRSYEARGDYDQDLEEYSMITKHEKTSVPYDFIHITPPMSAPDSVKDSALSWQKGNAAQGGWVEVDKETLQHRRYPNVFSFGDVAGIPLAKTGGSVREQYKIAGRNLISVMQGKEPTEKYGGYTVCPLITGIGKVLLAEFDWSGRPTPTFPLNPFEERRLWWLLKVYLLKPLCLHGMLKGML